MSACVSVISHAIENLYCTTAPFPRAQVVGPAGCPNTHIPNSKSHCLQQPYEPTASHTGFGYQAAASWCSARQTLSCTTAWQPDIAYSSIYQRQSLHIPSTVFIPRAHAHTCAHACAHKLWRSPLPPAPCAPRQSCWRRHTARARLQHLSAGADCSPHPQA